jgi:lysozyme
MTREEIPLALLDQLKRHEGIRLKLYRCPAGYLTIGYGRNIEANGITKEEAESFLVNDILQAERDARKFLGDVAFNKLNLVRQCVVINMAFNLGYAKLSKFVRLRVALISEDYERAALSMEQSKWATQVKSRAKELVRDMRVGKWSVTKI